MFKQNKMTSFYHLSVQIESQESFSWKKQVGKRLPFDVH